MRKATAVFICLLIAGTALAEKPFHPTGALPDSRVPCGLQSVTYDWTFADGDQGFTTAACDVEGAPVWEHGPTTYIPGAPAGVWATVLEGDYATKSGDALLTPEFTVTEDTRLLEIYHYYDMENLWDGGNVTVNGTLLTPELGYPGMISVPGDWYAWCVDFEMGFTGLDSGWWTSCFDLTPFLGQTIQVAFEFGSDDMFVEAGWYIGSVKVGSDNPVSTQPATWSGIKSIYR